MRRARFIAGMGLLLVAACSAPGGKASLTGSVVLGGVADVSGIAVSLAGPTPAATTTNAAGGYRFDHLVAGRYTVTVAAPSTQEASQHTSVDVAATGTATVATLGFHAFGTLTGAVTLPLGDPAPEGTEVEVRDGFVAGATDAIGHFTLRHVPVGARTVVAHGADGSSALAGVTVAWNATTTAPPLVLRATGGGAITGVAYVDGEPVAASVSLRGPSTPDAVIDASGDYAFARLPSGDYTVVASAPSTVEGSRSIAVNVPDGVSVRAPPIALTPAGIVSGRVTLDGAATGNAGIVVLVTSARGRAMATTDDTGHYTVSGAPAGDVQLEAAHAGYAIGTAPATVTYDATVQAPDLSLSPAPAAGGPLGTVSGVASLVGGGDPSGITVTLEGDTGALAPVATGADGSYAVTDVPPGVYTAHFDRGPYHETIPRLLSLPGGGNYVIGDTLVPLGPVVLPRARRLVSFSSVPAFDASSPDGRFALFEGHTAGSATMSPVLVSVDLDNGTSTTLAGAGYGRFAMFAPDGRTVLFIEGDGTTGGPTLESIPVTGGPIRRLLGPVVPGKVKVTADGRTVVAIVPTDTSTQLETVPLAGGPPHVVGGTTGVTDLYALSPDGSRAVISLDGRLDAVTLARGIVSTLVDTYVGPPVWFSPDGGRVIVLVSVGYGEVRSIPVDGGAATTLATDVVPTSLQVARGGTYLVFIAQPVSTPEKLVSLPTDGRPPVTLYQGTVGQTFWLDPAGDHVFFDTPNRLLRVPIDGGQLEQDFVVAVNVDAISADDGHVAWDSYATFGGPVTGLHVLDVASGSDAPIADFVPAPARVVFSAAGDTIVFEGFDDSAQSAHDVMVAPSAGGPAVEALPHEKALWHVGAHVLAQSTLGQPGYGFQVGLYDISLP